MVTTRVVNFVRNVSVIPLEAFATNMENAWYVLFYLFWLKFRNFKKKLEINGRHLLLFTSLLDVRIFATPSLINYA